jgi:aminopeptidase YwaD
MLHVTETPWSLPTFITDIGDIFAEAIRDAAAVYAADGSQKDAAIIEDRNGASGTRNAFFVDETPYAEGSDHDDYDSSTIAVPALYLRDWPDIYIHTDHDTLEQIDATKLRRVALLGAAAGYSFATLDAAQSSVALPLLASRALERLARGFERAQALALDTQFEPAEAWYEARNLISQMLKREQAGLRSLVLFTHSDPPELAMGLDALTGQAAHLTRWIDRLAEQRGVHGAAPGPPWRGNPDGARVPVRVGDFGPLTYQNDDVLLDRLGAERVAKIKLLESDSSSLLKAQERGAIYAYEIVNFIDGKRTVAEIRDAVAAEFGPIAVDVVADYLRACEDAKIVALK